jgi:hypothetical protein
MVKTARFIALFLSLVSLTSGCGLSKNCRPRGCLRAGGMKILARRIQQQLEKQTAEIGHCAIYEEELQRLWPLDEKNRKAKIEQFAREFGFKLSFYRPGLCAIFEK